MNLRAVRLFPMARMAIIGAIAAGSLFAAAGSDYLDQYFNSERVQIHYVERGAGEPVVLVAGTGSSLKAWIDAGALDLPYHVIALNCGGEGKDAADGVIRLLDHMRIPRAHIVSYADAGDIVAELVRVHPDRVLTATFGSDRRPEGLSGVSIPTLAIRAEVSDKLNPQFIAALVQFLHAHPTSRRLWAPREETGR